MSQAVSESVLGAVDAVLCDLDGVLMSGHVAIPGSTEAVAWCAAQQTPVRVVTNNASRTPGQVAAHLQQAGFAVAADHIMTSACVALEVLAQQVAPPAAVLVVGSESLRRRVGDHGYRVVCSDTVLTGGAAADAVIQGFSPTITWVDLAAAARVIAGGARWVATNSDAAIPLEWGLAPGNGALVNAVRHTVPVDPVVAGKPAGSMFEVAAQSCGVQSGSVLMVGDRLDTDITGAVACGMQTAVVLSGVTTPELLLRAAPAQRPDAVGDDLWDLTTPRSVRAVTTSWAEGAPTCRVNAWAATCPEEGAITVAKAPVAVVADQRARASDLLDGLWACVQAAWARHPDGVVPQSVRLPESLLRVGS